MNYTKFQLILSLTFGVLIGSFSTFILYNTISFEIIEKKSYSTNTITSANQKENDCHPDSTENSLTIVDINIPELNENKYLVDSNKSSLHETKDDIKEDFHDEAAQSFVEIKVKLNEFDKQDIDPVWSIKKEEEIKNYLYGHELFYTMKLKSIECKTSSCEVKILEKEQSAWDKFYRDLSRENWWNFRYFSNKREVLEGEEILIIRFAQ
ncbi:hypothetical protein [Agarilytica rhodophyticola]|uniref:hypothetical protein n=1 Tax=Agarilytica rhodophyticola TaxID=1737490 RepID=UPI000B346D3D|nr:hypothetical protein [Agarilytica rhodophyticola]